MSVLGNVAKKRVAMFLLLLGIFSILVTCYCQYHFFADNLLVHSDVNTFLPAVYHLIDPTLFANDLPTQYILAVTPQGYLLLLSGLGHFIDPMLLVKSMPFFLIMLSFLFLFFLGKDAAGDTAGFIMCLFFIFHCWTFQTFQGLTPRAFAYPLLLSFLFYLVKKKYMACAFLFILQLLFYPVVAVLSLFVFFLSVLGVKEKRKIAVYCPVSILLMLIFSFCFVYVFQRQAIAQELFGSVVNNNDMLSMPEFYPGGRTPFFFSNIIDFLKSRRSGIELNNSLAFIFFILLLNIFLAWKKKIALRIPREIRALFLSSVLLYILSHLFILRLYWPSRYVIFSIPIVCFTVIGVSFSKLIESLPSKKHTCVALVSISLLSLFFYASQINGRLKDYRYLKGVINFLVTLPKNSTVASTPSLSEPIPVFTKKKVLFSHRLLIPFHKKYYQEMKARVFDFYNAYYSDSINTVKSFCVKYSVDYIVFSKLDFSFNFLRTNKEYEPFNSYLLTMLSTRKEGFFCLPKVERNRIIFEDDKFVVINTVDYKCK